MNPAHIKRVPQVQYTRCFTVYTAIGANITEKSGLIDMIDALMPCYPSALKYNIATSLQDIGLTHLMGF